MPTCVTRNCKKEKEFNSLATKECLYLITRTANLMVVNQWHVIQAEQPYGFIDEWHFKLLLEHRYGCHVPRAGTEPYQTAAPLLRANFCLSASTPELLQTCPESTGQRVSCRLSPAQRRTDPLRSRPVSATSLGWALNFREKQAPS